MSFLFHKAFFGPDKPASVYFRLAACQYDRVSLTQDHSSDRRWIVLSKAPVVDKSIIALVVGTITWFSCSDCDD